MKKLWLLTTSFPFGKGEDTFINPELLQLAKRFDLKIFACETVAGEINPSAKLPDGVRVIRIQTSKIKYVINLIASAISPFVWRDVFTIHNSQFAIHNGPLAQPQNVGCDDSAHRDRYQNRRCAGVVAPCKLILSFAQAVKYAALARGITPWFKKEAAKNGAPDIIYAFWHRPPLLAALRHKDRLGNPAIVCRAHGFDLYEHRQRSGYLPFHKWADNEIDGIYLVSQAGYDYYIEHFESSSKFKVQS